MARRRPIFICPTSNAASVPRRAEAAQYRTASEPCSSSRPIGVTTLPLDFDIFLRSGSRIQPLIAADDHGSEPCSRCERTTVENSQVRMMSWPWGRRSMGNTRLNRSGSVRQPPTICGVSELVAQVSMMSGSADEAAGHAALVGGVAGGHVGGRVDGQLVLGRQQRRVVLRLAVLVQRVPDRERHAEEPLPRHEPVAVEAADPVLVADLHEVGVEPELGAAGQQRVAQGLVATAVADVPLAAGDDLEGLVALLVEVRLALGGHRLAVEVARSRAARRRPPRVRRTSSCRPAPRSGRARRRDDEPVRGLAQDAAVAAHHRARRQLQLAPPLHVGQVAERAAHRDAGALVGLGQGVRQDGDLDVEQRRADRGAEQVLVALVVRVRDERDAGRQQLGAGRLDVDRDRRHRGTRPGGTRPGSRGPRARPGRPPSGTSRPTGPGASAWYASPRARLRRNACWATARDSAETVW